MPREPPAATPFAHGTPTTPVVPPGTFRVVGTGEDTVTLLRVADADGHRTHTGAVHTVSTEDWREFEPAADPDGDRSVASALASTGNAAYWQTRAFARQLVAHPLPAGIGAAVLAAGLLGEPLLPDAVAGVLIIAGSLALAAVGGGHLDRR